MEAKEVRTNVCGLTLRTDLGYVQFLGTRCWIRAAVSVNNSRSSSSSSTIELMNDSAMTLWVPT